MKRGRAGVGRNAGKFALLRKAPQQIFAFGTPAHMCGNVTTTGFYSVPNAPLWSFPIRDEVLEPENMKSRLKTLALSAAAQALRLVPGSAALRWKRDLRDAAWLADADAVVISFPKSGRTFVRAMLARLFQLKFGVDERRLLDFPSLKRAAQGVPRLLFVHAGDAMREPGEMQVDPADYAGRKIVLLARHPADVAVSRYHHLKHRSRDRARR